MESPAWWPCVLPKLWEGLFLREGRREGALPPPRLSTQLSRGTSDAGFSSAWVSVPGYCLVRHLLILCATVLLRGLYQSSADWGASNNRLLFPTALEAENPTSRHWLGQFLVRTLPGLKMATFFLCPYMVQGELSSSLPMKATNPITRIPPFVTSSNPDHFAKAPPANSIAHRSEG